MSKNNSKEQPLVNLLKEKDALMMKAITEKDVRTIIALLGHFYYSGKKQGLLDGMVMAKKYLG